MLEGEKLILTREDLLTTDEVDTSLELWNRVAEADDNDDNPEPSSWANPKRGPFDGAEDSDLLDTVVLVNVVVEYWVKDRGVVFCSGLCECMGMRGGGGGPSTDP